jgi:predicted dehydrogenase
LYVSTRNFTAGLSETHQRRRSRHGLERYGIQLPKNHGRERPRRSRHRGFSDRIRSSLVPSFQKIAPALNFEFVALSDIWNRRRDEGAAFIAKLSGKQVAVARNNDELYQNKDVQAVMVGTADFQHAFHGVEAIRAGRDAYVEKPLAHTMEDAQAIQNAVKGSDRVFAVGTQRRSSATYQKAYEFIKSGSRPVLGVGCWRGRSFFWLAKTVSERLVQ